jgi:D-alanine transaminase
LKTTVWFNGAWVARDDVRVSPDDRGFLFGDGVYEVVRSYGGRVFALDEHMARLRYALSQTAIAGVDTAELVDVAREILARNSLGNADATVYIQVTRGVARRSHRFPSPPVSPTVYVAASPFAPPPELSEGVSVITVPDIRWSRCDIKSINLLPNCMANERAHAAGASEAIFVRDSAVLEGSHTSVFVVLDGVVRTAPANNYILPGITRDVLLELCREAGLTVSQMPAFSQDLARADEIFLCGTTVEVAPVLRLDGATVGRGTAGPITRRLQQLFRESTAPQSG